MTHRKIIHPWTRRQFLKTTSSAGAFLGFSGIFPSGVLLANSNNSQASRGPFFILIQAFGGMDTTLGLDAFIRPAGTDEQDMFIEYTPSEILSHPGQSEMIVGPAAAPILSSLNNSIIINGIVMNESDNGHIANLNYITSGNGQGKNATLAGELIMGQANKKPFGIVTNGSAMLGKRALAVTQSSTIIQSLESADVSTLLERVDLGPNESSPFARSVRGLIASKAEASELIRLLKKWQTEKSQLQHFHAVAATFMSGMATTAQLTLSSPDLDSHASHPVRHMNAQKKIWQSIADIHAFFKSVPFEDGSSLFDHTTFMVVSDFSRTPYLNPSKGKDHNPLTNSVLISGGAIKRGKILGKSTLVSRTQSQYEVALHVGLPIDYNTGSPVLSKAEALPDNVNFIHPENVARTVGELMGIDLTKVGTIPTTTKSIPLGP